MALVLEWDFDLYQKDELLIAIYTQFVPCQLAYWLNKILDIRLIRAPKDLYDEKSNTFFPLFSYEEVQTWQLITNKVNKSMPELPAETEQVYIKELFQVDYLLRVSHREDTIACISLLKGQKWIDMLYEIPLFPQKKISQKEQKRLDEIKAKLIF